MRRFLTVLLCLALALGLAAPALAEDGENELEAVECGGPAEEPAEEPGMDAGLEALTLKVKEALDVGDEYTEFYGDYYDGPSPYWSLNWSNEARQMTVEVRPDGRVSSVYIWEYDSAGSRFYGFDPAFPPLTLAQATEQAEDWMDRLITAPESARLDSVRTYLGEDGYYRFTGTVEQNGLDSPITLTMVVGGSGLSSYYRSDAGSGYVGQLPAPEAALDGDEAAGTLAEAVELELRWVSDGEGGARLMYCPVGPRTVVDPDTGEAVDMDALYASFADGYGMNATADVASAEAPAMDALSGAGDRGAYLTETELASIASYGDALDEAAIDEALRAVAPLGLDQRFEMQRCSYSMDSESEELTASVRYTAAMTEEDLFGFSRSAYDEAVSYGQDLTVYKTVAVDAKTGDIQSVSTSYPLWEETEDAPASQEQQDTAEAFLQTVAPALLEQAEKCTLQGYNEDETITYAQVHEGHFYPDNAIRVTVNAADGTVDSFRTSWEDVDFGPAEDLLSPEEALAAYADALDVTLGYVAWPVDVTASDDGAYASYTQWGYTYVEELRLAYYYSGTDTVRGVDAVTGEADVTTAENEGIVYEDGDDVAASPWREQIEALALAGVGFGSGRFRPAAPLTVRDGAELLLRASSGYYVPKEDEALLQRAKDEGFLTDDADPSAELSRMDFIKMILGPSRYGDAAKLTGVWAETFTDVTGEDMGYAALAGALGLAEGDTLSPDETVTHEDAALMLYGFMDR